MVGELYDEELNHIASHVSRRLRSFPRPHDDIRRRSTLSNLKGSCTLSRVTICMPAALLQ